MKCPNCGGNAYAVDTLNCEWELGKYYDTVEGICPHCGKSWRWIEVYTLDHCKDVEEIKENDHL